MKNMLVLYHLPFVKTANTINEHVSAFERYSRRYNVVLLNTECGFPQKMKELDFDVIVLHYSLFGLGHTYMLNRKFLEYLEGSRAYKVAFFQDEYHYCKKRFDFLNRYAIDSVFTLLDERYFDETYYRYTDVKQVHTTYTGYVDDGLIELAEKYHLPLSERNIDISYRARELPYYMGREAQEKTEIAKKTIERLKNTRYRYDIAYDESSRLYGEDWFRFLADSRAVLGVEAGVSIFDLDGEAQKTYEEALRKNPDLGREEIFKILEPWEGRIHYRTISPRIFEAAAFRVCQILYEGDYQGVLQPMVHYIPLKKDFSNMDQVLSLLDDHDFVEKMTERAYRDLIESGKYSYRSFIKYFEDTLPETNSTESAAIDEIIEMIEKDALLRTAKARILSVRYMNFPGKKYIPGNIKNRIKKMLGVG